VNDVLPGANSPQLLTRMLDAVARGVRTSRGLQEVLQVQAQTVRAYLQAAAWLQLVSATDPVELSPLGVEYVYAGARRPQVYARAVWSVPLAAEILVAADGRVPDLDLVARTIERSETGLAPATLERRAGAVRSLVAPAVGRPRPRPREQEERQLGLPLGHAAVLERTPELSDTATEYDPDAYRYVLCMLLDHGELSMGHLRALLDRGGARNLALGGILDLATSRGDAVRTQDRLIVTPGAVERRELARATPSLLLSDPQYRAYVADAVAAKAGDRRAEIRRDAAAVRFRPWDRRLFGHPLAPDRVERDLERVLLDRPLTAFPVARPAPFSVPPGGEAFLDVWEERGHLIALPPTLAQLQGGLAAVNRMLRAGRSQAEVALPDLAYRPVAVHGGVLHPGEPVPRAVPDVRTLRHRVLMHSPYAAVLAAVLLLHRHHPDRVQVLEDRSGWVVKAPGSRGTPLLAWIDGFAAHRGWVPVRRESGGLPAGVLVAVFEVLGLGQVVGRVLVLAEPLFARLGTEPEELEILGRLRPLADAVDAWSSAELGGDTVGDPGDG
jgi:hypothetical protein